MSYKIAIGSSDGINTDLKFGEVEEFLVYEVEKDKFRLAEKRIVPKKENQKKQEENEACKKSGCNSKGCGGNQTGCMGAADVSAKVELIADCRCVVCKKIGFQAQKQFERKAISVFDVECTIADAIAKISYYYDKIDNHQSLKG